MRFLFAFAGGTGHADPLVPIARAARAAGHDVAFAGRPTSLPPGEFEVFADGAGEASARRGPLRRYDLQRELDDLRSRFGGRADVREETLPAVYASWRPDAVVCDETDFGAQRAAAALGLPRAVVIVLAAGGFIPPDLLPEGPPSELVVAPLPQSFRDPAFPLPPETLWIRPAAAGHAAGSAVYATLGTAFTLEAGDLLARVLDGLRGLDVIATVGTQFDAAEPGPQPGVRIERFVPQAEILPRCRAVVCHGGSGSVVGALAHGLPLVVLPLGADQGHNADRVAALGAGIVLDAVDATPATIREAVDAVLDGPHRAAAERLRDEAAALPGPELAVSLLTRL